MPREPRRIQLRRTKGWRKPEGAVVVARPTKWGNPFRDGLNRDEAVELYTEWMLRSYPGRRLAAEARFELAGRDLACWCPDDQPCHADVLLEIANQEPSDD